MSLMIKLAPLLFNFMERLFSFLLKHEEYNRHHILLLLVLLSLSPAAAQESTPIEKQAEQGYANRFTDTIASLQIQREALGQAQKAGSKSDEAICYAYLAMTYRRLSHLKEFTEHAERSYDIASKTQNDRAIAYANWAMGLLRSYIDDRSGALDYMLKAYRLFEQLQQYDHCAKLGSDISYLFSSGAEAQSQKYADEALSYADRSGDPESILHARLAVGSYLSDGLSSGEQIQWRHAVDFFKQTIALAENAGDRIISKSNIGIAHINLAVLYMNGPKPIDEQAFLYNLERATHIGTKYSLKNIYRSSLGLRGQFFVQRGEYRIAENLFKEGIAYQHTLPYKDNDLFVTFYGCLKDLAARENDYQSYYKYDQLFSKYNKLRYDESTQQALQNTDARFESEKRLSRIGQLEKENELQKKNKFLGYGISVVLLIGLIFMYRSYYYRQRYYRNREDILQQQQTNSELKVQLMERETLETLAEKLALERRLLQSQMDPHFIFNLLGSIQSMILQNDRVTAVSYLGKFAKLTRQVLEQSRMEHITLEEEISTLKNYIELQQLRLNNSFDYQIDYEDTLDINLRIPPLLIQPFVENAIEHGLKPLSDIRHGLLDIYLQWDSHRHIVECTIVDNGIGLKESRSRKTVNTHHSLSTRITDERLALMHQHNPYTRMEVHERDSESGTSGCIVTLYIPIL
jgi:hypothetical protein